MVVDSCILPRDLLDEAKEAASKSTGIRVDRMLLSATHTHSAPAAVGGLGLSGTMSLNVLERTREIGLMRAVGAVSGTVRSIVLTEGALIGLLSWVIALPLSWPASHAFAIVLGNALVGRPWSASLTPSGPAIWLVIVLTISTVASLLPARRAAQISVREALAYE